MSSNRILHITYDLRGPGGKEATTAVRDLIEESRKFAPITVIDLLRVGRLAMERTEKQSPQRISMDVFGLPYGLLHRLTLRRAAEKICRLGRLLEVDLESIGAIHCHKVSFEGLVGYFIAKKQRKPLIVTLRQTDYFVIKYRPDLRFVIKRILRASKIIFYVTPYITEFLRRILGRHFFDTYIRPKLVFLPNIVERKSLNSESSMYEVRNDKKILLTILRMTKESVRRKNLKGLLKAFRRLDEDVTLRIIGDGEYLEVVKKWIKRYDLEQRVALLGYVDNERIDAHLRKATAFVMPSFSETFGIVYAEACINGTPILYSKGTGFDGMFEHIGAAVDPRSTKSVFDGLVDVIERNQEYRREIGKLSRGNAFSIFSREHICRVYSAALRKLMS